MPNNIIPPPPTVGEGVRIFYNLALFRLVYYIFFIYTWTSVVKTVTAFCYIAVQTNTSPTVTGAPEDLDAGNRLLIALSINQSVNLSTTPTNLTFVDLLSNQIEFDLIVRRANTSAWMYVWMYAYVRFTWPVLELTLS